MKKETEPVNGGVLVTVKEAVTSNQALAIAEIVLVWVLKWLQVKRTARTLEIK
jgi:hypothetical protein